MFGGYFDESSDQVGKKVYCIAGYLGRTEVWLDFETRWKGKLKEHGIKYFRASECENCTGEFAKFRDKPRDLQNKLAKLKKEEKERCKSIKTDFVTIVTESEISGVGSAVLIDDFNEVVRSNRRAANFFKDGAHYLVFQTVSSHVGLALREEIRTQVRLRSEGVALTFDASNDSGKIKLLMTISKERTLLHQSCLVLLISAMTRGCASSKQRTILRTRRRNWCSTADSISRARRERP